MTGFVRFAWLIAAKDLRIEWRSREILYTMGFLAALVVLVFAVAFDVAAGRPSPAVLAGILWLTVLVSGSVALGKTFDREREGEAVRALLLTPTPRAAIFAGKLFTLLVLMLLVEVGVFLLVALLMRPVVGGGIARLAVVMGLGTLGFATVGALFSAALLRARGRDVLLSVMVYPVVMPLVLAGARGAAQLLGPVPDLAGAALWTEFLAVADALYLLLALWSFGPIATGD